MKKWYDEEYEFEIEVTGFLRGADFAEVFDENTLLQETEGNPDGIGQSKVGRDSGVGIRIFKDKNCYYGYTNDRSEKALKELIQNLTKTMKGDALARAALQEKKIYTMGSDVIPASLLTAEKRLRPLKAAVKAGMEYDEEIVQMKVKLTDMEQMVQIANTEGLFVEDHREKTRLYKFYS